MRSASRIQPRTQLTNHASPVAARDGWECDAAQRHGSLTECRRPVRPGPAGEIERHHLERRAILVPRDQAGAALLADLGLDSRHAAERALFIVGKDPFDQWMP